MSNTKGDQTMNLTFMPKIRINNVFRSEPEKCNIIAKKV